MLPESYRDFILQMIRYRQIVGCQFDVRYKASGVVDWFQYISSRIYFLSLSAYIFSVSLMIFPNHIFVLTFSIILDLKTCTHK